jgi:hypothetical protein
MSTCRAEEEHCDCPPYESSGPQRWTTARKKGRKGEGKGEKIVSFVSYALAAY